MKITVKTLNRTKNVVVPSGITLQSVLEKAKVLVKEDQEISLNGDVLTLEENPSIFKDGIIVIAEASEGGC